MSEKLAINKIVIWVIAVLVLIAVLLAIFYFGLPNWVSSVFLDLNSTEEGRQIINEQESVPIEEKDPFKNQYPVVRLIYNNPYEFPFTFNLADAFAFRWNKRTDKIQIMIKINGEDGEKTEEWLVNPILFDMFRAGSGLDDAEKSQIEYVMRAVSENDMDKRISEVSKDECFFVDFPIPGYELESILHGPGKASEMSEEEIKSRIIRLNPEAYETEIKEKIKQGESFVSPSITLYFDNPDIWAFDKEDSVLVRWNFINNRAEVILRPNGEPLDKNEKEFWINDVSQIREILSEYGYGNAIYDEGKLIETRGVEYYYDTGSLKHITAIEDLLSAKKPSELSQKTANILNSNSILILDYRYGEKPQFLNSIQVDDLLFGTIKNPDEFQEKINELK